MRHDGNVREAADVYNYGPGVFDLFFLFVISLSPPQPPFLDGSLLFVCAICVVYCAQIPALGIRADAVTFANCTMESEKFITVREQTGEAVMIHMVFLPASTDI